MTPAELADTNEAEAKALELYAASLREDARVLANYAKDLPDRLYNGLGDAYRALVSPIVDHAQAAGLRMVDERMRQVAATDARARTLRQQAEILRGMEPQAAPDRVA